ncbi:cyclic lactone autoinducer peptide [Paenibacillus sp. FJAT-26967]|nr:cyclic lactone autoinducer peptide [Paenibacillus sp. FJAT-26967]
MKRIVAMLADKLLTRTARQVTHKACWWGCHRPEDVPQELFQK